MPNPDEFIDLLRLLLVSKEFSETAEEADKLIKNYPNILIQGIMAGPIALRATAIALQMKRDSALKKELV